MHRNTLVTGGTVFKDSHLAGALLTAEPECRICIIEAELKHYAQ